MKISLIVFALFIQLGLAKTEKIKVFAFHFPPFTIDEAEGKGLGPDLVREACRRADIEVNFVFKPAKRAMGAFRKGEGLIISTFNFFPEEEFKKLEMTKVRTGLYVLDSHSEIKSAAYVRGLRRAQLLVESLNLHPFEVADYNAGIKALIAGRVQGLVAMNAALNFLLERDHPELKGKLHLRGNKVELISGGLLGQGKHADVLERIRNELFKMKADGTIKRLFHHNLHPYLGKVKLDAYLDSNFRISM